MKKLLSFFIAGALAVGLAGCSGDLHDEKASDEIYIIGSALASVTGDNGWEPTTVPAMEKTADTSYSFTGTLVAGEYKFILNRNWSVQWGSNGKGTNQDSWKITDPGMYTITYDVATETMTATSLSTALDDPQKIATIPWLYGGIGSVKLKKDKTTYTGSFSVGETGRGSWGEDEGFIRCALISCIADNSGNSPNVGGSWENVVTRYGSGTDDPQNDKNMSTGGYAGLKDGNYCPVGTAYTGLVSGGNFVIKGVEANTSYNVVIEMATGSPVITITKK